MRKIFASILVLAMAITCFGMVAFAAPTTDLYFGTDGITSDTATGDTYTIDVYFNPANVFGNFDGVYYVDSIQSDIAVTNGTNVTTKATITNLDTSLTDNDSIYCATSLNSYEATGAFVVASLTITRDGDAETSVVTLPNAKAAGFGTEDTINPSISAATLTITWPSSEPATPYEFIDEKDYRTVIQGAVDTYGGIWVGEYKFKANDDTISKVELDFTAMEADKIKTYTFPTAVTGPGEVTCKIAIVGVPHENYTAPEVTLIKQ